jgi:hypothetical protein
MNIIFGDKRHLIPDRFTILELDTIRRPPDFQPEVAYCVVDVIPLNDLPFAMQHQTLHEELIQCYKSQQWERCQEIIDGTLRGRWNGCMDSFYDELQSRIQRFQDDPPGQDWDGSLTVNQS